MLVKRYFCFVMTVFSKEIMYAKMNWTAVQTKEGWLLFSYNKDVIKFREEF